LDLPNVKVDHQVVDPPVAPTEVTVDVIAMTGVMTIVMMDVVAIMIATTVMNVLVTMIVMLQTVVLTAAAAGRIITMTPAVEKIY
jgi:hypothetical protein